MGKPTIRPFRAVRYDNRVAGDLGKLLAPPYDVSSPDLIARLLERSPLNMIHLEHVRPDPGDNPHALAVERYRQWMAAGVLCADEQPALYRYDHTFTLEGERRTRRGIFAAVQLAHWNERIVLPHERTFPGPVAERLNRLRTVGANLSPIYLLADDRTGDFRAMLARESGALLNETTDPDGETHRLCRVEDPGTIDRISHVVAASQLFVADGHHRYEAALALRDDPQRLPGSDFVLALIADAADPDVVILPTHRVVRDLPGFSPEAVRARLDGHFNVEPLSEITKDREGTHGSLALNDLLCLVRFQGERKWWTINQKPSTPHQALMPNDRGEAWQRLPAAILEMAILELLGLDGGTFAKEVRFMHDEDDAVAAVDAGEAQIAFILPPPSVADLIAIARDGDRMPPKSTYFYPKVPAGLVVYDFARP